MDSPFEYKGHKGGSLRLSTVFHLMGFWEGLTLAESETCISHIGSTHQKARHVVLGKQTSKLFLTTEEPSGQM